MLNQLGGMRLSFSGAPGNPRPVRPRQPAAGLISPRPRLARGSPTRAMATHASPGSVLNIPPSTHAQKHLLAADRPAAVGWPTDVMRARNVLSTKSSGPAPDPSPGPPPTACACWRSVGDTGRHPSSRSGGGRVPCRALPPLTAYPRQRPYTTSRAERYTIEDEQTLNRGRFPFRILVKEQGRPPPTKQSCTPQRSTSSPSPHDERAPDPGEIWMKNRGASRSRAPVSWQGHLLPPVRGPLPLTTIPRRVAQDSISIQSGPCKGNRPVRVE